MGAIGRLSHDAGPVAEILLTAWGGVMRWKQTQNIRNLIELANEPDFEDDSFEWYIIALGSVESSCVGFSREWENTPWWMVWRRLKGQDSRRAVLQTTHAPEWTSTERRWQYTGSPVKAPAPGAEDEMAGVMNAG
jgi:hypothetical protein